MFPKAAVFLAVCIFWGLITTRQGQITTVTVPVRLHGIPEGMILLHTIPEELNVQLKSLSILTPTPARLDIAAEVDASTAREGQSTIRILNSDIALPSGMTITSISPPSVRISTERKLRKSVPVTVSLKGRLPRHLVEWHVVCEPSMVDIEGPASKISLVNHLITDDIDASQLKKGTEYRQNLRQPMGQVALLRDSPVIVRLVPRKDGRR
jgi:YbbR domain-containing protein